MEEVASPQLENGHTQVANEILEALAKIRIPGEAMQILLFILRKTYGWKKKEDFISLSQIEDGTHMTKSHIIRARNKLVKMNIISIIKNRGNIATNYEFNKNYLSWEPICKKGKYDPTKKSLIRKCYFCEQIRVLDEHHIIHKKFGGSDDHSNKICLCPNHHKLVHIGEITADECFKQKDKIEGLFPIKIMQLPKKVVPNKIIQITNKDNWDVPKKAHTKETITKETITKEKNTYTCPSDEKDMPIKPKISDPCPYEEIRYMYNKICCELPPHPKNPNMRLMPKALSINKKRKTQIRKAWATNKNTKTLHFWALFFDKCTEDDWLMGRKPTKDYPDFIGNLSFITRPSQFEKIVEAAPKKKPQNRVAL